MSRHYAFFGPPAHGHIQPMLPVAAELVRRGDHVTFATTTRFASAVAATGAEVLPYEPVVQDFATAVPAGSPDWLALAMKATVEESEALVPALDARLSEDLPDLLVYDATMNMAGRVLGRAWNRRGVETFPVFLPQPSGGGAFSLTGLVTPPDDPASERPAARLFRSALTDFMARHGAGDVTPLELVTGFGGQRLVFFPREFQPGGEHFDARHAFVGPCADISPAAEPTWRPPAEGSPVVLVSLGTTWGRNADFFRACAKSFGDSPWHAVLAVGPNGVTPESLGPLPPNVEVHRWLAYRDVLPHARAFVGAAGMGSLMLALAHGVPLVLAPQSGEQSMVARRSVELNLGAELPAGELSADSVLDTTDAVTRDDTVKAAVAAMRRRIEAAGGVARAADILQAQAGAARE
ncbi:macrolide family glycosyltransferase [Streptomyces sp. NPDC058221]|uniref:macrolide family glycosyltransferase n=1 Tax=Streptomyces sp. NPDC058221 TaxID=3346388 RepID=UPI0036E0F5D4